MNRARGSFIAPPTSKLHILAADSERTNQPKSKNSQKNHDQENLKQKPRKLSATVRQEKKPLVANRTDLTEGTEPEPLKSSQHTEQFPKEFSELSNLPNREAILTKRKQLNNDMQKSLETPKVQFSTPKKENTCTEVS